METTKQPQIFESLNIFANHRTSLVLKENERGAVKNSKINYNPSFFGTTSAIAGFIASPAKKEGRAFNIAMDMTFPLSLSFAVKNNNYTLPSFLFSFFKGAFK